MTRAIVTLELVALMINIMIGIQVFRNRSLLEGLALVIMIQFIAATIGYELGRWLARYF